MEDTNSQSHRNYRKGNEMCGSYCVSFQKYISLHFLWSFYFLSTFKYTTRNFQSYSPSPTIILIWAPMAYMSSFLNRLLFRAVLGSQQNPAGGTEISRVPPSPTQAPASHYHLTTGVHLSQLMNVHYPIIAQKSYSTSSITLGGGQSVGLNKCLVTCTHHSKSYRVFSLL